MIEPFEEMLTSGKGAIDEERVIVVKTDEFAKAVEFATTVVVPIRN